MSEHEWGHGGAHKGVESARAEEVDVHRPAMEERGEERSGELR